MRAYINSTEKANEAVEQIVALVKSGEVDPLIGLDLETSPHRSLVGYPNTLLGEDKEPVKPNKKSYLSYAQTSWQNNYNPNKLAQLGIYIPTRLTNGNESKGVPARQAWEQFLAAIEATPEARLEQARWTAAELEAQRTQVAARVEEFTALVTSTEAELELKPRGRINELKAALKRYRTELAEATELASRLSRVDLSAPMDGRLLRHVVRVGVQNRIKVDPVQPGRDPHTSDIFLVQFTLRRKADGELLSWIFNARKVDVRLLLPALRLSRHAKYLGANIKFDLGHLLLALGEAPQNVWCVRVASRVLHLGLKMSHSLAACAKRYAGIELSKEERNLFIGRWLEEPTEDMLRYAFTDSEVLFPVYDRQMQLAKERGQDDLIDVFSRLSYPTAVWELCGVEIDEQRWLEIAAQVAQARDEVARELEQMLLPAGYTELFKREQSAVGEELKEEEVADDDDEDSVKDTRPDAIIRISQRNLVIERLRDVLGERFLSKVFPDGKVSLAKDARELMETEWLKMFGEPHPFFGRYKKWSKLAKQASTYGRTFLWNVHPLTGRIHSTFNIAGTDTGRYSSNRPNLLNIPTPKDNDDVDFRAAFVAPEGYVLGDSDYASMEQRIAADGSRDKNLIALFEEGGDNHSVTAALMFHIKRGDVQEPKRIELTFRGEPIEGYEVPKGWDARRLIKFIIESGLMDTISKKYKKTTRNTAKAVAFLFFFGGSPMGLAKKQNIPVSEAEQFFADFGAAYPEMVEWFEQRGQMPFNNYVETEDGERYGYADAYNGLRRWFRLPHNPSRWEYGAGWIGEAQFREAQREYRKDLGAISREAKNVFCQGGNAVITAEAILRLIELGRAYRPDEAGTTPESRLRLGIFPYLAIYDELVVLVPREVEERDANRIIRQAMVEPCDKYMLNCRGEAEPNGLSPVWKKY